MNPRSAFDQLRDGRIKDESAAATAVKPIW
jgi:hypothetical protein